jgi:hypothetical protein
MEDYPKIDGAVNGNASANACDLFNRETFDQRSKGGPASFPGGWFRFPYASLPLLASLSRSEIAVLLGVLSFANRDRDQICKASAPEIAAAIGFKNSCEASRAMAKLDRRGIMPVVQAPKKGSPAWRRVVFSVCDSTVQKGSGCNHNSVCDSTAEATDSVCENSAIRCVKNQNRVCENRTRQYKEELDIDLDSLLEKSPSGRREMDTPEFRSAWGEWIAHLKEKGKPITGIVQAQKLVDRLCSMGPRRAIEAINLSIERGYCALYEPRSIAASSVNERTEQAMQINLRRRCIKIADSTGSI